MADSAQTFRTLWMRIPWSLTFLCHFPTHAFWFFSRVHPSQIVDQKIELKVESKVGSLANIKHRPGGGDKKVFNDVEYLRQTSSTLHSSNVSRTSSRRESTSQVTVDDTITPYHEFFPHPCHRLRSFCNPLVTVSP